MKTLSSFFKTIIAGALLFTTSSVFAAAPTWTRVDYTNTTAFVGWVRINYYDSGFPITVKAGDYIGAFVGTECRMIAEVFAYNGNLYVSSVIHGGDIFDGYPSDDPNLDNTAEEVEWKVWDNAANNEVAATVKGTLFSNPGGEILSYEIGKPNTNSDLESLSVAGANLSPAFSTATTSYAVELAAGETLPVHTDYSAFTTDSRATVTITPATDFAGNNVTTIRVTAEDGTFTNYTITYTQAACTIAAPTVNNPIIHYCVGDIATPLTANGTNLLWYTNPAETGITAPPIPLTVSAGIYTFYVSQTIGCESESAEIQVVVHALPEVNITPSSTAVCSDETVTLNLVPATGGTLDGDGTNGLTFYPSLAGDGSHLLTYSYTDNNQCSGTATTTIAVTEKSLPIVTKTTYTLELGETAPVLTANGSGTLKWYDESSNLVATGTTYQTTISTENEKTFTFTVTNTNGICESDPISITIAVSGCSTPMPTVSTVEYCEGDVASALSAIGNNLSWYSTATSDDKTSIAPIPSTTNAGTTSYYVSQTDGCESSRAKLDVIVHALPIVSITPSSTAVCSDETVTLNLVPATGGTLDGDGTNGLTFYPSLAGNGSHLLTYSYTDNNQCSNEATTTIAVTEKSLPIVAKTTYTLELGEAAPLLTASGSGTLKWYDESSNLVATGTTYQTTISTENEKIFTFTVTNTNETCESDPITITIAVSGCSTPMPTVSTVEYCEGDVASALSAIGNNLSWYSTATSDDKASIAPVPSTTNAGTTSYYVSQTDGCESSRAKLDVIVKDLPTAPTVTNALQSICAGEQASFTAIAQAGAQITWKNASSEIVSTQSLFSTTLAGQYTVTQEINGCESTPTQITLNVIDIPAAPIVADVETCEGTSASIVSSVISKWYTASTDVTPFATGSSYTPSVTEPNIYTYYVSQEISGCESVKVPVTFTIHEAPTLVAQDLTVIYGSAITHNLSVTTDAANTVIWYDATFNELQSSGTQYVVQETNIGTYYYYVEAINTNTCSSGKLPIRLQITDCDLVKPTITPTTAEVCYGSSNPAFTASGTTEMVYWYADANLTELVGQGTTFMPSVSTVGSYTYYAVQKNHCTSPSESVNLRINALPNPQIFAPTSVYQDAAPVTLSLSPTGGSLLGSNLSGNSFDPSLVTPGYYTFSYTYTDVNSCSSTTTHQIQVLAVTFSDRTQLGDTIARAESIYNTYVSSDEFTDNEKQKLQSAIDVAQYYYDNYQNYSNSELFTQSETLSNAIQDFLDSRVSVIDVSALIAKRDEAVNTYQNNEYKQGSNVGQIPSEAFAELQNAIDNANSYIAIPPATYEEVLIQVNVLETAIQTFLDSEITQPNVDAISVQDNVVNLIAGEQFNPTVVFSPVGSYGDITWSSSNAEVASVIAISGTVTASDISGTAQITGTLISNPSITLQYVVQVSGIPEIISANLIGIANKIELEFSEVMKTPLESIYTDLIVAGVNPMLYTIVNVQLDPQNNKKIIVTLGNVINDPNEILISYTGTSIQSYAGAPASNFDIKLQGTAVDVVEANVLVYPTISSDYVYIEGVEDAEAIYVVSTSGQKILDVPVTGNKVMIDVQALAQGTYTIRIVQKTNSIQAQFIKK